MASNDNIRDGFNELLGGINKDLEAHRDGKTPPESKDDMIKNQSKAEKAEDKKDIEDTVAEDISLAGNGGGTRVFDTVKQEASEKDLSDFELEVESRVSTNSPVKNISKGAKKPVRNIGKGPVQKKSPKVDDLGQNKTNVFRTVSAKPASTSRAKVKTVRDTISALSIKPASAVKQGGKSVKSANNSLTKAVSKENKMKKSDTSSGRHTKKSSGRKKKDGILGGITKFVLYIVFVLAASVFCATAIINVANDVFAFVKPENTVMLNIPEDASTKDIAKMLADNDIIEYPTIFRLYTDFKKGRSSYYTDGYKTGEFELAPNMNYDDLIYSLSNSAATRQIVRLTFPEGSTVDEIIDILIKGGVQNTKEEYIDVIQNYDFTYRFVKELDTKNFKNGRKYRLEGYLFPDTYDFYTDAGAVDVINKFLINFNNKFDATFYDASYKHGLSVDEIINIAALIEKEARRADDMGKVSSVFHNRIKHSSQYPYLQSDATIQYAFPERKTTITPEDLKYDSPYNTYLYAGLPPSAIANPGLDAITFALYPEQTSYYFFIANSRGETLFAKTLNGHNANIEMIRAENAARNNQ